MSAAVALEHQEPEISAYAGTHVAILVDVAIAADLVHCWSAGAPEALARSIRRSGALQRYVRGSRPRAAR